MSNENCMTKMDYKKAYKELYQPKTEPSLISVPMFTSIMVEGKGDPNTSDSYKEAVELLYALSYTIKMGFKKDKKPIGYVDYVVFPLEGLWWFNEEVFDGRVKERKDDFNWIMMIRQPDFVTEEDFDTALKKVSNKKPNLNLNRAVFKRFEEGLCAQVMHIGAYDDEPATIAKLDDFIASQGYRTEMSGLRRHHEIYLSDPRKCAAEKLKTVIRHPIVKR